MKLFISINLVFIALISAFVAPNMVLIKANPDFAFKRNTDNKIGGEKSPIMKDYFIAVYPVTNGEYAKFLAENKSARAPKYWKSGTFPKGKEKHPVLGVSYEDALRYCDWLSKKDAAFKYRLPTEAEWEYAASGKSRKVYPWGDDAEIVVANGKVKSKFNYNGVLASELLSKNLSVCFVTAFEFNNLMLRYHTSDVAKRSQYMDFLLDCDMLIIDDLGTEPVLKSVTKEYLYNVVDTRIVNGKKTMITSNLNLEELMARYGERTISRMTNKSYSVTRELLGDDLRKFRF